jgi:PTH1 family peptidyl-tRNA hydrolase
MLWNAKPSVPVFVASLGNPKPYLSTLHSAGHIVLTCIAAQQKYNTWRPFAGGKIAEKNLTEFSYVTGYSMQGEALPTLWQSGALMNVSGKAVKRAWNEWKKQNGLEKGDASAAKLVIVHDELERELGAVSVRTDPKASARGHNGIKSVMAAFAGEPFIRIGVGIGRPESREKDAVSSYVLRKITPREGKALEQASLKVMQQIAEVSEGAIG